MNADEKVVGWAASEPATAAGADEVAAERAIGRAAVELAADAAMAAGEKVGERVATERVAGASVAPSVAPNPSAITAQLSESPAPPFVYLDYAATAPLCEEAALAMESFQVPGPLNLSANPNANALYGPGRAAFDLMENARRRVAAALGARRPDEIVFTSGATEADNAAIAGLVSAARERRRLRGKGDAPLHVVTSAIEHDAVLAPCKRLEAQGVRVTYLAPSRDGFVTPDALAAALTEDTVLVSVQMANSEVGSVQPVRELAAAAHRAGALFHTDAVQALGKAPLNLEELGVDAASFSAHKIGGPKGIGVLYLRARTPFDAFMLGGGQETGRRSGTQNVAGIVGFAAACEAVVACQQAEEERLRALRDRLYASLAALPGVRPTVEAAPGSREFLPNIAHVLVDGLESETMVLRFDQLGICVAGGSACSSHSLEPSHVLRAMGVPTDDAYNALRISMGRYTAEEDIDAFLAVFEKVLNW